MPAVDYAAESRAAAAVRELVRTGSGRRQGPLGRRPRGGCGGDERRGLGAGAHAARGRRPGARAVRRVARRLPARGRAARTSAAFARTCEGLPRHPARCRAGHAAEGFAGRARCCWTSRSASSSGCGRRVWDGYPGRERGDRQVSRRVRRVRGAGSAGRGEPRLPRPVRPPAPRPGVGRDRRLRREGAAPPQGDGVRRRHLRPLAAGRAPGVCRGRPRALRDGGKLLPDQRPADGGQDPPRPGRARPQREPGQRAAPASRAGEGGGDLPVHLRQRGVPAPAGALAGRDAGGGAARDAGRGSGRVLAGGALRRTSVRGARPPRLPPARPRAARRNLGRGLGDLRVRPHRGAAGPRGRPGRGGGALGRGAARAATRPGPGRTRTASSSTSTSPVPTRGSSARTSGR